MLEKTDLNECKRIAKKFLELEIEESDSVIGIIVHPFFNNVYTIDEQTGDIVNILEDKSAYDNVVDSLTEKINKVDDYIRFSSLLTIPYKLAFLKYTMDYVSQEDFSRYLIKAWTKDEYANQNINVSKNELLEFFKKSSKQYMMDNSELETYSKLDDVVTVYRGVTDYNKDNVKALSWTLDKEKAEWFAHRFNKKGYVYKAKIDKKDILTYCDGRNEKEVIVDYTKLYDLEELQK